ncbi:MAG: hypothetical protein ABIC40_02280 [bacterium]
MKYISIAVALLNGLIFSVALGITGCSGDPVEPSTSPAVRPAVAERTDESQSGRYLWGYWDVTFDKTTCEFDIVPLRELTFHLNALQFLEPPALAGLDIDPATLVFDPPANKVAVDVVLTHPFPGLNQYSGFDVRGIVILPGSGINFSDPFLIIPANGEGRLVNADGWTRWWNPKEFVNPGIFGFKQGLIGQPGGAGVFTATLNGYKYFANGLGAHDSVFAAPAFNRGMFAAGAANRRNFNIDFGVSSGDFLKFQYAIDASWEVPSTMNNPDVPGDFPLEANAPEGYAIKVTETENTLWWFGGIGFGGELNLSIDVYDWNIDAIEHVMVEAPGIISAPVEASVVPGSGGDAGDPTFSTYTADIIPDSITATGVFECLIKAETDESYNQGGTTTVFGPPAAQVTNYHLYTTLVDFDPGLEWETLVNTELPVQPYTNVKDLSVVNSAKYTGVFFFGNDYGLYRYPLNYVGDPQLMTTMAGFFNWTPADLYGIPAAIGRLEVSDTGQFMPSTTSTDTSPTFYAGLKRDYVFFFNNVHKTSGQPPVQVGTVTPDMGYFKVVDICAASTPTGESKIYWTQVDDPDESTPPNEEITVILGVFKDPWTGNPWEGSYEYLCASVVPGGSGNSENGAVNTDALSRFAIDGSPKGLVGSSDLIGWFLETNPMEIECFSIVSTDKDGDLNLNLSTIENFHGTPRDVAVFPSNKAGYDAYNWLVVLEEGSGTWSIECFNQYGQKFDADLLDVSGYPANVDVDTKNYQIHVWYSTTPGGPLSAMVLGLTIK